MIIFFLFIFLFILFHFFFLDICKHGKETNRYSKKSQQNIISFRIVKDLSPLKGSISRSLHEKSFNLYSHTRTILHLRGIKFFSSSQRCTKNDFAHVPFLLYPSYAFAHIRANALLLVHYCVLMVSRNGVTSRRQFSLFSSTASLYSTLLPFSLSLSLLHPSFHLRLTFYNVAKVFLPVSTRSFSHADLSL